MHFICDDAVMGEGLRLNKLYGRTKAGCHYFMKPILVLLEETPGGDSEEGRRQTRIETKFRIQQESRNERNEKSKVLAAW